MLEPQLVAKLKEVDKYLTRYDRNYLNILYKQQEPNTHEQDAMYEVILSAIIRRAEKDNYVIDLPESHIEVYKKYYLELSEKEKEYVKQLHEYQWWSYTKAQQFIIDILNERIKLLHKQNKNK